MKLSTYTTDAKLEDGVWIDFDDASFLIAATSRPAYQKALDRARRGIPLARLQRDASSVHRITKEALASACLLDWKNVQDDNGNPLPCTPENKLRVLEVAVLRDWIAQQAGDISNFQHEATAEDAEALKSGDAVGN